MPEDTTRAEIDQPEQFRRADEQEARREHERQRAASLEPPLVAPNPTQRAIIDARFHGLPGLPDRPGNPRWAQEFTEAILRGEYGPRIARAQAHAAWGLALVGSPAAVHTILFVAEGFEPLLPVPDEQPVDAPAQAPTPAGRTQKKPYLPRDIRDPERWPVVKRIILRCLRAQRKSTYQDIAGRIAPYFNEPPKRTTVGDMIRAVRDEDADRKRRRDQSQTDGEVTEM